jgi:acetoin utilization protein AcuB
MIKVSEYMTQDPITLDVDHRVYHAYATMELYRIRHIPILNDDGHLVGIVSDRDLKKHIHDAFDEDSQKFSNFELMHTRLEDLMTSDLKTSIPSADLADVASFMLQERISSMPIVAADNNQKLIGILTDSDLLNVLVSLLKRPIELD